MEIDSTKNGNLFDGGVRKTTNLQVQEIAAMFKIVQFPKKLQPFFEPLREQFLWDHFHYFRLFVLLIAFAWGRRNVCSLYRYLDETDQPHRSRFNNFLNLTRWQPTVVLALKAQELLAALSPQPGETVELILDDSKKRKRGKAMQAVCWMKDPLTNASMRGHQYVTAVLSFRGYTIPFGVRLYVKKEDCRRLQRPFRKTTELAAELIREFQRPQGVQVRVLFDMTDFHGWEAGALWEDTKFAIKHFADIEKLAMVGEAKWQRGMATFCKPFTKATVRYFDHADAAKAREWLCEA